MANVETYVSFIKLCEVMPPKRIQSLTNLWASSVKAAALQKPSNNSALVDIPSYSKLKFCRKSVAKLDSFASKSYIH